MKSKLGAAFVAASVVLTLATAQGGNLYDAKGRLLGRSEHTYNTARSANGSWSVQNVKTGNISRSYDTATGRLTGYVIKRGNIGTTPMVAS